MADQKVPALSQFTLSETPDGYLLEIEGDDGASIAVEASPAQLDAIIDALADLLEEEDEVTDEVGDDDDDEEEPEDHFTDDPAVDDES